MSSRTPLHLALAASSLVVALGAGELVARWVDPDPAPQLLERDRYEATPNPRLRYRLRPGAPDGRHRINSAGFRDRETPPRKPPDAVRIVAVGDSVTYGSGARETSYPEQLERLLREWNGARTHRFEVLNLGVRGYNITQVAERLRVLGLRYEPDVVVYGYVLNDPQAFSLEAAALERLGAPARGAWASLRALLGRSRLFQMAHQAWSARTFRRLAERDPAYAALRTGGGEAYFRALHSEGEAARRLERGLAELARLQAEHEVPVVVAILPVFLGSGPERYPLAELHERLVAACRAKGLDVLDLRGVLLGADERLGRRVNVDPIHLTPLGHRVLAAALLRHLQTEERLPGFEPDLARIGSRDRALARLAGWRPREP